jgi:aminocarboxymuconate-semialdehyde decarboxylase
MTIDRRTLLGALGTAAAAGLAAPAVTQVAQAQQSATASSPSKAKVIDVHTHMYSRRWQDNLRAANDTNVKVRPGPNGDSMVYRWAPIGSLGPEMFDWDARIAKMDAAKVDIALISLSAPNVYWGTREVMARAAREINDEFAAAQAKYDGRIRWFASLPWMNADDSIEELRRAKKQGAIGVCTLTNVLGNALVDARFRPIWREIEAMRMPTFIHPTLPFDDGMGLTGGALANAVGFTCETSLCFSKMMIDGFLDAFPRLDLIACHGGGTLPYLAARIDRCWDRMIQDKKTKETPSTYLKRLYFDSIVYDQPTLNHLVNYVGVDRILYGSDYPFSLGDMPGILGRVDALPTQQRDKVRSGNSTRLFDL